METRPTYITTARGIGLHAQFQDIADLLILTWISPLLPLLLVLPIPVLRVPIGLALVLFAPGYALAAALFPRHDDLDGIARAALSFGLSIAALPVLALLLSALPWGIRPWPMVLALAVWIALCCTAAIARRLLLARSGVAVTPWAAERRAGRHGQRKRLQWRYLFGALAVVAVLFVGAIALFASHMSEGMTEFYVLGARGLAQEYPRQVRPGDQLTVTLGIANQELSEQQYRIEIWAFDARQPDQRTLVKKLDSVALAAGERWEQPVTWRAPAVDSDKDVELLLFLSPYSTPYRRLHLSLDGAGTPSALR